VRLLRLGAEGAPEVLAESTVAAPPSQPLALQLAARGVGLEGSVNGAPVVRAFDSTFTSGQSGLLALAGQASFAEFFATDDVPSETVPVLVEDGSGRTRPGAEHGLFDRFIGDLWKPADGSCTLTTLGAEPAIRFQQGSLRYYTERFGDVALAADVLETDGKLVSLTICAGPAQGSGYTLGFGGQRLEVCRNAQSVGGADIAAGGALPMHLVLRREGPFVVAQAGTTVVSFRDPEPLPDGQALVGTVGSAVLDNLDLGADHALAYRFDRIEPDWTEASGDWMFHSGMACIPWAYWLSGDGREQPAVLWNRVRAPADLALHFDVSEYTEGHASGDHTHFPYHDISLVLCGDGAGLDSGYRFVIGADGGLRTRLLKQGQVVATTEDPRFRVTMGSHCNTPRAIEVLAVKNGGELRLSLNGGEALRYTDPEPLQTGQVALGVGECRANFRDLFLYWDRTWETPLGASGFGP